MTTLNKDGTPHTTGILYEVSPPSSKFALYCLTSKKYKKARNIEQNPNISLLIPFPHFYIRFAPSSTVTIQGKADFIPTNDMETQNVFRKKRILRLIISEIKQREQESLTFIRIKPQNKVLCYGLGFNIFKLRKGHAQGGYSVIIPQDRLFKDN
ncbi:MAG: pyridoxamine 5'-phosphate oxidase family protein [Candidatus Heimdallarchaeota archaeon]|nr:MAG: pyridoxamine 5'-phosphate oxidase family protein [Candidatus Heimdallarchaeota archaeon]